MRSSAWLLLVALAGCGRAQPVSTAAPAQPAAGVCRVGPDGGPAEGTIADKGIGGTGDRARALADRGIGGTGIVAVITGFGSLCLAGQEVAMPAGVPVVVGTVPADEAALRAGQVAIVEAGQTGAGLSARRVTVRFEVSGPVDRVTGDGLVVAGQDVVVTGRTLGLRPGVGDWVAVSGVRRADGVIEATRLEARGPGAVVVHGVLTRGIGGYRVGTLAVTPAAGLVGLVGRPVTVSGVLLLGELQTEAATADVLVSDPGAYFGPGVDVVLFQAFGGERLEFGSGVAGRLSGGALGLYRLDRLGNRAVPPTGGRDVGFGPASGPGAAGGGRGGPVGAGSGFGGASGPPPGRGRGR